MADDKGRVLVTGGTGYLGGWCVVRLLQSGWRVRATVRDLRREAELRAMVASEVHAGEWLEVVAADLMSDAGWSEAAAGSVYVLHVASPFPDRNPKHPDELIRPAREGTLRVLRAAKAAGVKRVVVTSSVAAVAYGHAPERYRIDAPPMTAADWTEVDGPGVSAYAQSKTLAERAAREWAASEGGVMEIATVNPSGIFGPTLGRDTGTSLVIVERLLKGALPGLPPIGFQVVDVRDTADLHLLAMTRPEAAGGRLVATGEWTWFADFARTLREVLPAHESGRVPTRRLPGWLLRMVALVDPQARGVVSELGRVRKVDSGPARALGWTPRPARDTILDSARSLIDLGIVKP